MDLYKGRLGLGINMVFVSGSFGCRHGESECLPLSCGAQSKDPCGCVRVIERKSALELVWTLVDDFPPTTDPCSACLPSSFLVFRSLPIKSSHASSISC